MLKKLARLFVIKNRFEAALITYALALGACQRGAVYLEQYPGGWGYALFLACTGAVFMAGAKIFDALRLEKASQQQEAESAPVAAHATTLANASAMPKILP